MRWRQGRELDLLQTCQQRGCNGSGLQIGGGGGGRDNRASVLIQLRIPLVWCGAEYKGLGESEEGCMRWDVGVGRSLTGAGSEWTRNGVRMGRVEVDSDSGRDGVGVRPGPGRGRVG